MDVKGLPQMQDETSRRNLFLAVDRHTRWMSAQLRANETAVGVQVSPKALPKPCQITVTEQLTDSGKESPVGSLASKECEPSGICEFDQMSQETGIEPRLRGTENQRMAERFKGRVVEVLKIPRSNSREDREQTLLSYVAIYNQ